MSTKDPNPVVGRAWAVYVDDDEDFTLSIVDVGAIEWRATDTNTPIASGIAGHALDSNGNEGLTRTVTGTGFIQLRVAASHRKSASSVPVALTTWTP